MRRGASCERRRHSMLPTDAWWLACLLETISINGLMHRVVVGNLLSADIIWNTVLKLLSRSACLATRKKYSMTSAIELSTVPRWIISSANHYRHHTSNNTWNTTYAHRHTHTHTYIHPSPPLPYRYPLIRGFNKTSQVSTSTQIRMHTFQRSIHPSLAHKLSRSNCE